MYVVGSGISQDSARSGSMSYVALRFTNDEKSS